MRAYNLLGVAALQAILACAINPDPRARSVATVESDTLGAWVIVTDRHGHDTHGELISVEPTLVRVLAWSIPERPSHAPGPEVPSSYQVGFSVTPTEQPTTLVAIPRSDIARARLFRYTADDCVGWGVVISLSTVTHLLFAVITFPAWVITAITMESIESRHVILEYPDHNLEEIARWARFPQGMPPDLDLQTLSPTDRTRPSR